MGYQIERIGYQIGGWDTRKGNVVPDRRIGYQMGDGVSDRKDGVPDREDGVPDREDRVPDRGPHPMWSLHPSDPPLPHLANAPAGPIPTLLPLLAPALAPAPAPI